MITQQQCQKRIFNVAIKLGVSPKLIATRLLSIDDKNDMVNGLIPDEVLEIAVRAWMDAGMPDYANGLTNPYKPAPELPMQRYRGMGKR
jgi:hypothetical protein